jgi:uncharacterized protein YciW
MRWAVRVELNKNHAGTNSSERRSATALAVCRATWWAQRERERYNIYRATKTLSTEKQKLLQRERLSDTE